MCPGGDEPRQALDYTAEVFCWHGEGHKFRMYDDDGELYYTGLFIGDADSEDGFKPLDDFGEGNAGCTRIDYFEKGKWVTL